MISGPFPCGKHTPKRGRRSAETTRSGEGPSVTDEPEQDDPGDLPPTESPLDLLAWNRMEASPTEDTSDLVRIVGGRDCTEGECPWQVTAGRAWWCVRVGGGDTLLALGQRRGWLGGRGMSGGQGQLGDGSGGAGSGDSWGEGGGGRGRGLGMLGGRGGGSCPLQGIPLLSGTFCPSVSSLTWSVLTRQVAIWGKVHPFAKVTNRSLVVDLDQGSR